MKNPNSCESPLGICLYHLGTFAGIERFNSYKACNGVEIRRDIRPLEIQVSVEITRACRLYVFGKQASFDISNNERMFDLLLRAWSMKIVGTAFTLRVMAYLLADLSEREKTYCSGIYKSIQQRSLSRLKHRLLAA